MGQDGIKSVASTPFVSIRVHSWLTENKNAPPESPAGRFELNETKLFELRGIIFSEQPASASHGSLGVDYGVVRDIVAVPGSPDSLIDTGLIISRHLAAAIDKDDNGLFASPDAALSTFAVAVSAGLTATVAASMTNGICGFDVSFRAVMYAYPHSPNRELPPDAPA